MVPAHAWRNCRHDAKNATTLTDNSGRKDLALSPRFLCRFAAQIGYETPNSKVSKAAQSSDLQLSLILDGLVFDGVSFVRNGDHQPSAALLDEIGATVLVTCI